MDLIGALSHALRYADSDWQYTESHPSHDCPISGWWGVTRDLRRSTKCCCVEGFVLNFPTWTSIRRKRNIAAARRKYNYGQTTAWQDGKCITSSERQLRCVPEWAALVLFLQIGVHQESTTLEIPSPSRSGARLQGQSTAPWLSSLCSPSVSA